MRWNSFRAWRRNVQKYHTSLTVIVCWEATAGSCPVPLPCGNVHSIVCAVPGNNTTVKLSQACPRRTVQQPPQTKTLLESAPYQPCYRLSGKFDVHCVRSFHTCWTHTQLGLSLLLNWHDHTHRYLLPPSLYLTSQNTYDKIASTAMAPFTTQLISYSV